jgi:hypothetical protein
MSFGRVTARRNHFGRGRPPFFFGVKPLPFFAFPRPHRALLSRPLTLLAHLHFLLKSVFIIINRYSEN